jgi:hypothetical protein
MLYTVKCTLDALQLLINKLLLHTFIMSKA